MNDTLEIPSDTRLEEYLRRVNITGRVDREIRPPTPPDARLSRQVKDVGHVG